MTLWTPTREKAIEALENFLPHAGRHYAALRNFDRSQTDAPTTSALSPYIRRRIITEEEVCRAVMSRHGFQSAEKYLSEVCWRTYWKGWLEHRPSLWSQYVQRVEALRAHHAQNADFKVALSGETGIEAFDHWTRQLVRTGWLHNHTRMWFASIWIFTLELPWELGADFFARHLLDFDAASNTLSWRWVAGLHTRGKTYLARPDNIAKFTDERFRPSAHELASHADPVTDTLSEPERGALALSDDLPNGPFAFLITEEDCSAMTGLIGERAPDVTFATVLRAPDQVCAPAIAFDRDAVKDALSRHGCGQFVAAKELPSTLAEAGLSALVLSYVPQGPARDRWLPVRAGLTTRGITVHELQHRWDKAFWPHAKAGFFGLKKKMPGVFSQLDM